MCGIAGVIALGPTAPPPDLECLTRMAGALRHRGPDEFGVYRDRRAGLAHARLSIIDLTAGQQPLTNEDGTLWISFNGEIFNYVELRKELVALGHVFRTRSDTEVIVHAYEAWGDEAFARFNGQFAVALWDARRASLVLARDRLGVRPLYIAEHAGRLYFASEVKALFAADRSIPRALDPEGLDETFTFWTVIAPRTAFQGISELRPGHVRTYAGGVVRERAFWRARFPMGDEGKFRGSLDDAVVAVREALREATRLRMLRADVPVGSYLSGGLDSSLVAALALEFKGNQFSTFSLRFEDDEYDESAFQSTMVRSLGSAHHEVVVSRQDIARAFREVIFHTERPILRTAPAPLFLLSKLVRDTGIKVVLTGEGADEMFAGYDLFREGKVRRFWARHPASTRRPQLLDRLYPYLARSPVAQRSLARHFFGRDLHRWREPGFAHSTRWETTGALKRLFSPAMRERASTHDAVGRLLASRPPEFEAWGALDQDAYLEMRTLLSGYLLSSQGDRMLMAHSVEGRFPFLDTNVVALASSLPAEYKLRVLDEKHVLKRASAGLVPSSIVRRPKQPYRAPDALSFLISDPATKEWVEEAMSERAIEAAGIFEASVVAQLWKKCRQREREGQLSNADNMAVVGILSTQVLDATYVRGDLADSPAISLTTNIERSAG